jgi:hypothetical protein
MDPEKIKAALEAIKNGDAEAALKVLEEMLVAAAGGGAPPDPAPEPLAETPDPAPAKEDEQVAAAALMKLTGASSVGVAILECDKIKARLDADDQERAAAERVARRDLVAELVKLGIEFPSTAWAGDAEKRVPVKRLAEEPLDELRARVELHRKAAPRAPAAKPPASGADVIELSARELAMCAEMKLDPKEYAAQKVAAKKA